MAAIQNNVIILNETDPRFSTSTAIIVASGGVATIQAATPTKAADAAAASPWTGAVVPMVDGDGTTSQRFTGICKTTSTDTASTAGVTTLWLPLPGYIYAAKTKLSTDANTAAKINALFGKRVVFDLTSSLWTVDSAAADAVANNLVILGGDYQTQTIYFNYAIKGSMFGFSISA